MKAIYYESFGEQPRVESVPDPRCAPTAAILRVRSSGLCLSDWHGWKGHDPDIVLPHVPGHEFCGEIVELGKEVRSSFKIGDRVLSAFIQACGSCHYCHSGQSQVCPDQRQAGFTHWGSFAEYVEVPYAQFNLVHLPNGMRSDVAALLGCRFATAFHATTIRANNQDGWSVVFGCGGVGLSIIKIERALGRRVIGVDLQGEALVQAQRAGAEFVVMNDQHIADQLSDITNGQIVRTYDAIGSYQVATTALEILAPRGQHLQIGLLPETSSNVGLSRLLAQELTVTGCHGISRNRYPQLLEFLDKHQLDLKNFVSASLTLDEAAQVLPKMHVASGSGVAMINL